MALLYWFIRERQANPYMGTWELQNFPALSSVLNWVVLYAVSGVVLGSFGLWILNLEYWDKNHLVEGRISSSRFLPKGRESSVTTVQTRQVNVQYLRPFYELIELRTLLIILALLAQSIALWIVTASTFTISTLPPDSFYYASHLPFTYWWGFAVTLGLLFSGRLVSHRLKTVLEISSLLLVALYVLGLPSFVYDTPRILDSYQHMGNTLGLINNGGWLGSPIWYVRQFPGAYTFFAQLILIPGIDSFSLMRYYVVGLSSIMVLFVYAIARIYSPNYAGVSTGLFLGALWFQLHLSPQSLELVLYLGLSLVLTKMLERPSRSKPWTIIALVTAPTFVVSHPETSILVIPGVALFLVFTLIRERRMIRELLPNVGLVLAALIGSFVLWWSSFAIEARNLIESVAQNAINTLSSVLSHNARTAIPSSPAYSYKITITSEQAISVTIWAVGLVLILLSRLRLLRREALVGSLFTVAVMTVPLTVFVRTDMLARSYLFSLLPVVIFIAWLLERRSIFVIRARSLHFPFRAILLIAMIVFLALLPLTRNGNDPEEHVPQASLFAASVAGELRQHSVLLLNFGEYGYWYYSTLDGGRESPKDQQSDMSTLKGGFVEGSSVLTRFNLTFRQSDASANYILLSDYYENLYIIRYGTASSYYLSQRACFESQAAMKFDLIFSTGTDRLYENTNLRPYENTTKC